MPSHKDRKHPPTEEAKKLFMSSEHMTWTEFCAAQGWNPNSSRMRYPVAVWVREKAAEREKALSVDIAGMMAERSENWWRDVNKTLKEYPELVDRIKTLIAYKVSLISKEAKAHSEGSGSFKVESVELQRLAAAAKACVEAKMQVLMLKDLQVKEFSITPEQEAKVVFELAGGQTPAQIREIMKTWNRK